MLAGNNSMRDKFKKFRVRSSSRNSIEPEEIFFDSSKLKEFEEDEINTGKLESPISPPTFRAINIIQLAFLGFLFAYTVFLVVTHGDEYTRQAEINSSRTFPIYAPRGVIYSSDGVALLQNAVYFDIVIKGSEIEDSDEELGLLSQRIADNLGIPSSVIYNKFQVAYKNRFSELTLASGVSPDTIAKINDHIKDVEFIEIREAPRREYLFGRYFAHLMGHTGEVSEADVALNKYTPGERIGKMGLEAFYDTTLRGETGVFIKRVDPSGREFRSELGNAPRAGKDITLHINYELQKSVFDILERKVRALGVRSAVAIVMDPRDGAILALVNIPSFDPNIFEGGISQAEFDILINDSSKPLFNRAVSGEYPSGSIIKPIIAAAALEEDIVSPSFLIYSDGVLEVPSVYNPDVIYEFKDWKAHGWADMRRAIADSVNIYFYTIGGGYDGVEGLGIKKIKEYLNKFGWGSSLGVDLTGERSGLIPSPKWKKEVKGENWYIGDTYHVSIGQGDILVTPLQVAVSTAVFANNGTLFSPKVAKRIDGEDIPPEIIADDFISRDNLSVVREGMQRAAEIGSSRYLAKLPIQTAGKTGTAQTGRGASHAWFTGFAPYQNSEIVVTILIEEGGKSEYAVHVAYEIMEAYFKIYSSPLTN